MENHRLGSNARVYMKLTIRQAVLLLCVFFFLILSIAFFYHRHFPVLVLAGENSVGTWMSGTLLIFMFALSFVLSMKERRHPWLFLSAFFMLLALDERFMFHERMKEWIIFSSHGHAPSRWIYEMPAMAGACAGVFVAIILFRYLSGISRILLLCVVPLGLASVLIDILAGGVFPEECFKLLAELLMVCALVVKVKEA